VSYSAVIPMAVTYTDGTPLFSVQVPVEDLADTLSQRLWPIWGDMVDVGLQKVDNYLQQKGMPMMRVEADRISKDAYDRAASLSLKTGVGLTLLTAGVLGSLYLYKKYGK
jgi:hypothetical protein